MSETPDDVAVVNDADAGEFRVETNGYAAFLQYSRRPGRIYFIHTEVPEALAGRGIAARLARAGLEFARAEGLKVVVRCPFVAAYIRRHKEYEDLVLAPG